MSPQLRYFAYVSRAKVDQLHQQLTELDVGQRTVTRGRDRSVGGEVSTNPILGLFKGGAKAGAEYRHEVQETGQQSVVHRLADVLEHIDENEQVLDLGELIDKQAGTRLNAFCYSYSGPFRVLGNFGTEGWDRDLRINADALDSSRGDIVISPEMLLEPARSENAYAETGPNQARMVSDICLIRSERGEYGIQLACSLKYFADMGGQLDARENAWHVVPHSGNHHFFDGTMEQWFEALLFINGVRDRTVMGTPLVLAYTTDPEAAI